MKKLDTRHEELLKENAFTLLRNHHIILNDPRMRYATINMVCGEAKNGIDNLSNPTVGALIDWWTSNDTICYYYHQGYTICYKLFVKDSWVNAWLKFTSESGSTYDRPTLNSRELWANLEASIAKHTPSNEEGVTPYTFEQVIETLKGNPTTDSSIDAVEFFYQKQHIGQLEYEIKQLHNSKDIITHKYHILLMTEKRAQLEEFCKKYLELKGKLSEVEEEKFNVSASLKKDVKNGAISREDANKVLDSIDKEIETIEWEMFNMKHNELATIFPNEQINIHEIIDFHRINHNS